MVFGRKISPNAGQFGRAHTRNNLPNMFLENMEAVEIEHIFCQPVFNIPEYARLIEYSGIQFNMAGNQIDLFTNAEFVHQLTREKEPRLIQTTVLDSGYGLILYDRGMPNSKLDGKSEFLINEIGDIAASSASDEAKKYAIWNLHEWTTRLLRGEIKMEH